MSNSTYSAAVAPPSFSRKRRVSFSALLCVCGTAVVLVFMVSSIGHGYAALHLIPSLPFLSDEWSGVLLGAGLATFNFVGFRLLVAPWTWKTTAARLLIGVCCTLVVSLDFILLTSALVKQSIVNTLVDNTKRQIVAFANAAYAINDEMTILYGQHLALLEAEIQKSRRGDDESNIATCGPLCRDRISNRDTFERKYYFLSHPAAMVTIEAKDDLNAAFQKLLDLESILDGRAAAVAELERERRVKYPVTLHYAALRKGLDDVRRDLFHGQSSISEQELILRQTASIIQRVKTRRASAIEYVIVVIAISIVVLVPGFAVAWGLSSAPERSVQEEVDALIRESTDYAALQEALEKRGRSKLNAELTRESWRHFAEQVD